MKQLVSSTKRVKAGTRKSAAALRRKAFAQAYIANGRNGTQAAIAAGFSAKGADVVASRLLGEARISALIDELTAKHSLAVDLTVERTLREAARISYFDTRRLYHEDGSLKQITEMDDDTRAAIMSTKHGLYERDNSQRSENLALQIVLVN